MNKTEMIAAIAEKADLTKKDAEKALKAFTDTVHSKSAREQPESALTLTHVSPSTLRLPRLPSSRPARL